MIHRDGPFNREHVAEFYDHIHDRQDVDFYLDLAAQANGPVLELGCGTGRVLIPIAREGGPVTGIDLSEHMLDVCRSKLAKESTAVQARTRLVHADIRDFNLGARFRLITIPFRPFQHLVTVREQLACLGCVHRHLEPGGLLALDVFKPNIERLGEQRVGAVEELAPAELSDGRTVRRTTKVTAIDLDGQVIDTETTYETTHGDGRVETVIHAFPFRYFFRYEVEHLLTRAGFQIEAVYGDFDGSPIGAHRRELIFVARRP